MTDIEQTELTVVSSFDGLIEGELYYSNLHDSVWRLKIDEPDIRMIDGGIDYRFTVVKDDVTPEYVLYSNRMAEGEYEPGSYRSPVGVVRGLEKLEQLIASEELYHIDTELPVFEMVDQLRNQEV